MRVHRFIVTPHGRPLAMASVAGDAEELEQKIDALTVRRYGSVTIDNTKKLFMSYDADGDVKIDKKELEKMLSDANIGNWLTRSYWVDGVFEKLDTDRDGKLTWEEYLVARKTKETSTPPVTTDPGKTVDPQLEGDVPSSWPGSTSGSVKTVGVVAAILALLFFL